MLSGFARLDVADVFVQQLQVFLSRIVVNRGATTRTFLHVERETLGLDGLIGVRSRIVIGKGDRGNLKLARMTGYSQEVVNHRALHTVGSQL